MTRAADPAGDPRSEVLFIGGRAGSGKTSVASALHELLSGRQVKHAVIEGDYLDMAYPPPWEHGLAETNLRALWANYRALGHRRLIYTNVMSVLETEKLAAAMGDSPRVIGVLLDVPDDVMRQRLQQRESKESLARHLERNLPRRAALDRDAPAWVHRIATDGRSLDGLAAQLARLTGWVAD
ncbi:ATPase [Deinococcus sp. KSM4-11]|uniref:AAA family ATPase n=1 Tax=Deinococcus sp. KSM4-11 TaxID=2568654 RepID=UPI0010A32A34|nr:AAA family ATPase [Deinococcus sp. KSM4-11]THF86564.1 ATPase [Deinococcus sp. KSM4-11]